MNPLESLLGNQYRVRIANGADAAGIFTLLMSAFKEFEALYTPEAFRATVLPHPAILVRMKEGPLWVVETGSVIIGTVGAFENSESVLVRGMAAHPSTHGRGVGKCLLDQVEQFATREGVRLLELYTTAFLDRAIRLYRAAGFNFSGERINPNGTELLRMTKALNR
jgi:GNAT superfamily N-acetyltransferase